MTTKFPLPLGSTIGILGGGQLGRMLTEAASRLGMRTHIFCPESESPAFHVSAAHTVSQYDDRAALEEFANEVDIVTFEFENVPAEALDFISGIREVAPTSLALRKTQDRLAEKQFLSELDIPVAPFAAVENIEHLQSASERTGLPAFLKTRRWGYDGKGQSVVHKEDDLQKTYETLGGGLCILEGFIDFDEEISVIAVKDRDGNIRFYDPTRNIHRNQILAESHVPADLSDDIKSEAYRIVEKIASALEYTGVLAVEMFYCGSDTNRPLIVNEIAPRVHNSGHWTQDACLVSQFENHIRAIAGWPLGATHRHSNAVMTNLIGDSILKWAEYAADPDMALHLYGKTAIRQGRKMGHATRLISQKSKFSK